MPELVTVDELTAALHQIIARRRSGAFFITSADQHSALITVRRGRITGLKYRSARGYQAAEAIADLDGVRYQTDAAPTTLPGEEPLDTARVLAILSGKPGDSPATGGQGRSEEGEGGESGSDLEALRRRYITIVGPIGGALFDEAVNEIDTSIDDPRAFQALVERLAQHIENPADAERFRRGTG